MPHPQSPEPTPRASAPRRTRGDRGLTTLEWLLIVAAVAGLAALAVVLVQNVVDDTAEQISGSSARLTAAQVAAAEITEDTKTAFSDAAAKETPAKLKVNQDGKAKCDRLTITYGDALEESGQVARWQNAEADTTASPPGSSAAQGCYIK